MPATVHEPSSAKPDYAISASADSIMSGFSSEMATIILNMASKYATKKSGKLLLVEEKEIKQALNDFCSTLKMGLATGAISLEAREPIEKFIKHCEAIQARSSNACGP
jgi:hypothetical protein